MFGAKKMGEKLATWLDERAKAYKMAAASQREAEVGASAISARMETVALVLEEVAKGIRTVLVGAVEEG